MFVGTATLACVEVPMLHSFNGLAASNTGCQPRHAELIYPQSTEVFDHFTF
jgi:hypothetical protein